MGPFGDRVTTCIDCGEQVETFEAMDQHKAATGHIAFRGSPPPEPATEEHGPAAA